MPKKLSESPRKFEMISLIDVIFLLLIFFLVVTSILPESDQGEKKRAAPKESLPIIESNRIKTYDMIIVLSNTGAHIIYPRNADWVWNGGNPQIPQAIPITEAVRSLRQMGGSQCLIRCKPDVQYSDIIAVYNAIFHESESRLIHFELINTENCLVNLRTPDYSLQERYGE